MALSLVRDADTRSFNPWGIGSPTAAGASIFGAEGQTGSPVWKMPDNVAPAQLAAAVTSFLDVATTASGRATHDNTKDQQIAAEEAVHDVLWTLDPALYAMLIALPGLTDRARMAGARRLLDRKASDAESALVKAAVDHALSAVPPQRALAMFGSFAKPGARVNAARVRKVVVRTLLGSAALELWSVKYRAKIRVSLIHAWGERTAGILRSILAKDSASWTDKEKGIIRREIDKYARSPKARACVSFVLGNAPSGAPLLDAFAAAKQDLTKGASLPFEVLEGLRSTYHKAVPKDEVLKLTATRLTKGQKLAMQRQAVAADVQVEVDPMEYDATRLYLYAFEAQKSGILGQARSASGAPLSVAVRDALAEKAKKAAAAWPVRYAKVGILLDASASMAGGKDQPLRPMAAALALRDMLAETGSAHIVVAGGARLDDEGFGVKDAAGDPEPQMFNQGLFVRPEGATDLAGGLVDLLENGVDAIFVLSDGYENCPAGRFAEVVGAVRNMGIQTPIFHLNPVFAAESMAVRSLAPALVPTLPVVRPEALGVAFLRVLLTADPARGLPAIAKVAAQALASSPRALGGRKKEGVLCS